MRRSRSEGVSGLLPGGVCPQVPADLEWPRGRRARRPPTWPETTNVLKAGLGCTRGAQTRGGRVAAGKAVSRADVGLGREMEISEPAWSIEVLCRRGCPHQLDENVLQREEWMVSDFWLERLGV